MTPSFLQSRVYRRRDLHQVQWRSETNIMAMMSAWQGRCLAIFQASIVKKRDGTDHKANAIARPTNSLSAAQPRLMPVRGHQVWINDGWAQPFYGLLGRILDHPVFTSKCLSSRLKINSQSLFWSVSRSISPI